MPSYTPERSWSDGDTIGASDLNTYLRDNVDAVYAIAQAVNVSAVQLTREAATSTNDSTYTDIVWDNEEFDFGAWWSSGAAITVPSGAIPSGYTTILIAVSARARWAANGTGARRLRFLLNGSEFAFFSATADATESIDLQGYKLVEVEAADEVKVQTWQSSGGALNISQLEVSVERRGPATV
jgi:hypothetical protein